MLYIKVLSFSRNHVLIWFEQKYHPFTFANFVAPGEADQLVVNDLSPKQNSAVALRKSFVASLDAAVAEFWQSRGVDV